MELVDLKHTQMLAKIQSNINLAEVSCLNRGDRPGDDSYRRIRRGQESSGR